MADKIYRLTFTKDDGSESSVEFTAPQGEKGEDGFSPVASVTQNDMGAVISITNKDGTTTATITNGKDGLDGYTPQKGIDYFDGGPGKDGNDGEPGSDGYTPVRGIDYWTADDVLQMQNYMDEVVKTSYEKGSTISSGDNLDNYMELGKFYANSNSIAASLINCPTTQNFVMYVFIRTGTTRTQLIIDLAGKLYIRSRSTSAWRDWVTYVNDKNVSSIVVAELAKYDQLGPEFANSIADCTDTSKLYVLPDGYIYAYMQTNGTTNQISESINADGSKYNGGKGWKTGYRLNSSGAETEFENWEVTGYIPVAITSKVYFANISFDGDGQGRDYLSLYDNTFTKIASQQITGWLEGMTSLDSYDNCVTLDSNGNLTYLDFSFLKEGRFAGTDQALFDNTAYFRLSAYEITDESIITVDEEIGAGEGGYAWVNTGHAFVPADYEDRIIELETEVTAQKQQIASLSGGNNTLVPDYVITEAESVIDRVVAAQSNRTFTFAALSDMHYGVWNYTDGITHACQALKYISERIELDAMAVLGDYTDGYPDESYDDSIADFEAINTDLDDLQTVPNLRLAGNHDIYTENPALTMRYINAYSDGVVWGNRSGGYFYRDFDGYKVRVIGVNTSMLTIEQYNWFVSALDLCNKEDVKDWSILVLSHHPLDWYPPDDDPEYRFCYILDGYKNGTSGTAGGVSYDFTGGRNAAKLIGNIHGHLHNFKVDYIHFGNVNSGNKTDVLRISTPNACYNRENDYEAWAEDTKYEKTKDSAKDTSFCVYCIDLDAGNIKAICYGAGYDREISYQYTNDVVPPRHTDTVSWNDLTDKPFGEESTILCEYAGYNTAEDDIVYIEPFTVIDGETYTIVCNGVAYETTPIFDIGMFDVYLGLDNTECPVVFYMPEDVSDLESGTAKLTQLSKNWEYNGDDVTCTVSVQKHEVKTMDEVYLPYTTEEWTFELADGSTVTKQVVLK